MNAYTEFFTTTTSDDQENYFTGETQRVSLPKPKNVGHIAAGEYRVIGGEFFQILSGVPSEIVKDEIKKRINSK